MTDTTPAEGTEGHEHLWQRRQSVTSRGDAMPAYEVCVIPGCDRARRADRPTPPVPAAEDDAARAEAERRYTEKVAGTDCLSSRAQHDRKVFVEGWTAALDAAGVPALRAEVERLRQWKADAMVVMDGLQDLGEALGLDIGQSITGEGAAERARALVAERDQARRQVRALNDDRLAEIGNLKRIIREERTARGADPWTGEPALAGSGEQPGEGTHTWQGPCCVECEAHVSWCDSPPAPVVPDTAERNAQRGYDCRPCAGTGRVPMLGMPDGSRAERTCLDCDGTGRAPVVPDSAGVRERVREVVDARIEAHWPDAPNGCDANDRECDAYEDCVADVTDAVLTVVGQGVTAEPGPWAHPGHQPVQHRDRKPPWCPECGWTSPQPAVPAAQVRAVVRSGEPAPSTTAEGESDE